MEVPNIVDLATPKKSFSNASETAKSGHKKVAWAVERFKNYKNDVLAISLLIDMGVSPASIKFLQAYGETEAKQEFCKGGCRHSELSSKTDMQLQLIYCLTNRLCDYSYRMINISCKKVKSSDSGFNHLDRRWIKKCGIFWNMPFSVQQTLQYVTGELPPYKSSKNPKRMYFEELDPPRVVELIDFFQSHKNLIIPDLIRGRGLMQPDYMLVVQEGYFFDRSVIVPIDVVIEHYSQGDVGFAPSKKSNIGVLRIGRISLQRKGSSPDGEQIQFKFDPLELFDLRLPHSTSRINFKT